MSIEAKTSIQQIKEKAERVRFYTPTPAEQSSPDSLINSEFLRSNRDFQRLVNRLTTPFRENSPNKKENGRITDHTVDRIQFFANGDKPYSPFDKIRTESKELRHAVENSFLRQAERVAGHYCADYFSPNTQNGFASETQKRKFFNMLEIAPQIVRTVSDRDNYISKVQEEHALNIIAAALHMVRYPETQMIIRVGIGGSDDRFTTARSPAYAIPALRIAEQMSQLYEGRKVQKMKAVAFEKVIQEEERKTGIKLEKEEKQEIDKQMPNDETARHQDVLTNEEYEEALKIYSISQNPVKIQFAFAHEASVAINRTKDAEEIRKRTAENIQVMEEYIATHFPNQQPNVEYMVDTPWSNHSKHTMLQIEYLSSLVRTKRQEDPIIDQTLLILERMGVGHGGEKGQEKAAVYAAAHSLIFGDRINLPSTNYFQSQDPVRGTKLSQNPSILITIGGEPEEHFCAIREFLAKEANPDGFKEFLKQKAESTKDEEEKQYLERTIQATQRWQRIVDSQRKNIDGSPNERSKSRSELPIHVIPLITTIGRKPVYYATSVDEPYGADLNQHLRNVAARLAALKTERKMLTTNPNRTEEEERRAHNEIILTEGVEYDLRVLAKEEYKNGGNKLV